MTYTLDELVINDSFIAYCTAQNEQDVQFWNDYLREHPRELITMEEAKKLVLSLRFMLQQKQNELSAEDYSTEHMLYVADGRTSITPALPGKSTMYRLKRKTIAAAAILLLAIGASFIYFFTREAKVQPGLDPGEAHTTVFSEKILSRAGQRKTIVLADGTRVTLNAASTLSLEEGYGTANRNVYLAGEAFFDVAHNKTLPFIVHVAKYKVKAVGTKFNVKAYANDEYSETSLLEGKVQILIDKGEHNVLYKTLEVNQKFVLHRQETVTHKVDDDLAIVPLSFGDTSENIETAWMNDHLIFDDLPLSEIKNILERKYGVRINILNNTVAQCHYSASFQDESIGAILKALQLSYPFSYKINGTTITIDK